MIKQNINKIKISLVVQFAIAILIITAMVISGFSRLRTVQAQSISDQINSLKQENENTQKEVDVLAIKASSYQDMISKLEVQISSIQTKIIQNEQKRDRLEKEIKIAQDDLEKQKALLGENIKAMYLEGDISTLEMLASSKDLSDFVDKEQYRDAVKDKIKSALDKVTILKAQLKTQKGLVDKLLREQETLKAQALNQRSEQQRLLSFTEDQKVAYQSKINNNNKIDELIASQRRANFNPDGGYYFLRFPGAIKDFDPQGYSSYFPNAGFGMSPGGCLDNDGPDEWGYCTRQCVSYAAWAVYASGRTPPVGYGNARDWVGNSEVPVYRTPQPGDVAISTSGYWGHAMYVESVSGNTFTTSEYNTYLTGELSYQTRSY